MAVWFTADTHFGSEDVIDKHDRPFDTIEEHDAYLVLAWNAVVARDDLVWHLGDVLDTDGDPFTINRLNGNKYLIQGNWDRDSDFTWDDGFLEVFKSPIRIRRDNIPIILSHKPLDERDMRNYSEEFEEDIFINIHGDVHGEYAVKSDGPYCWINAGVDVWDYTPVSSDEINALIDECRK